MQTATRLVVLGSTGSVGCNTLAIASHLRIPVHAISAKSSWQKLAEQAREHRPRYIVCVDEEAAQELNKEITDLPQTTVLAGAEALITIAEDPEADTVMTAIVGSAGLPSTLAAVQAGKRVCIANKEPLVVAGSIIMAAAKTANATILPVDSEHSAIFQCLQGHGTAIDKIILTGSGGPFRTRADLHDVSVEEALNHPNWSMGAKITIDSATLMNKALEVIEAHHLFAVPLKQIEVLIHPESVIHSMVAFGDGSVMAQLGEPDMRTPIQYALTWPEHQQGPVPTPDFAAMSGLHFEQPRHELFPSLELGREAVRMGGLAPCVFNAANEVAVQQFLDGHLTFTGIFDLVAQALAHHEQCMDPTLEDLLACDQDIRLRYANGM